MWKIYLGLVPPLALIAALVYRAGYQEVAATLWFFSLILTMPIMRQPAPALQKERARANSRARDK